MFKTKITILLWLSAFVFALLSMIISLHKIPLFPTITTTTTSNINPGNSFEHSIYERIFKQSGTENLFSHLTSMVSTTHHHHHHHHTREAKCDQNKWASSLIYKYNAALVLTVGLNGCANFSSVQKAVDAVPERSISRTLVIIDSGTYRSVFFGEYQCEGPGANYTYRASYAKQLQQAEANSFMDISYINGNDWLLDHPNIISSPHEGYHRNYNEFYSY
ncbi:probable pectinesterase 15 [Humulus lupulus]|uniref:probable pectinesterase 15 n=1 Tax=Humulus lupulus TaxID=3486 RepID=UPI002B41245D|nr:probable pectinesterase 15 [Humulus lupulus]